MGRLSERYDVFGQDTYTPLEEEHFASEMGQPSIVPREHHAVVLCQTPVQCEGCGRHTKPFESVIVLVDGDWFHEGCAGPES